MSGSVLDTQHELWFDDTVDLGGENITPDGLSYWLGTVATDATWGNPTPVDVAIDNWLRDGAVVTTQSYGNRELFLRVEVSADSSTALAAGEADLFSRCDRRTTLQWIPPQGSAYAATTVFEIWTTHIEHYFDDLDELELSRTYGLRMTAKPWARSADTVTVGFPANGSISVTSIDACASTTGWAATAGGTSSVPNLTTSGGAVLCTLTAGGVYTPFQDTLILTRTGAVSMSTSDTLVVQANVLGSGAPPSGGIGGHDTGSVYRPPDILAFADGVPLVLRAQANGTYWFACTGSFTTLTLSSNVYYTYSGQSIVLSVSDVSRGSAAGSGYITPHELMRTFPIEGSARTSGSVLVSHPTNPLGDLVVWTGLDDTGGFVPGLRGGGYRVSGPHSPTTDSSTMSGAYEDVYSSGAVTPVRFRIPASLLREGEYAVLVRMRATTAGQFQMFLAAYLSDNTGALITAGESVPMNAYVNLTTSYQTIPVGNWTLPPAALDPAYNGFVTVDISCGTTAGAILDEIIVADLTHGSLTVVDSSSYLQTKIDSADVQRIQPTIWLGQRTDLTDSIAASLTSKVKAFATSAAGGQGGHVLPARGVRMFVATGYASSPAVWVTYYPRWLTNAGS